MALDWDTPIGTKLLERLQNESLVWMTTVDPDGMPRPSLVWFLWTGDRVLVYSRRSMRVDNLARNQNVALNFNSDADGGSVGSMTGIAEIVADHPGVAGNPAYVEKYRQRIERSLSMSIQEFSDRYPVPVVIEPLSGRAW